MTLRKPLFIMALIALALALCVEASIAAPWVRAALEQAARLNGAEPPPGQVPGAAILAHLVVDGMLALFMAGIAAPMLAPAAIAGRAHAIASVIGGVIGALAALAAAIAAYITAMMMISLLVAAPFGTLAYIAVFGGFPKAQALAALGVIAFLKLAFFGLLVAAHHRFLTLRPLLTGLLLSMAATVISVFLFGLLPGLVASIVDQAAAVIVSVIGLIAAISTALKGLRAAVGSLRV